jgi:hypothetical protein
MSVFQLEGKKKDYAARDWLNILLLLLLLLISHLTALCQPLSLSEHDNGQCKILMKELWTKC